MTNYTLLNINAASARISKKFKIISFFVIFGSVMCFYYAKRSVDSSEELSLGLKQSDDNVKPINYKSGQLYHKSEQLDNKSELMNDKSELLDNKSGHLDTKSNQLGEKSEVLNYESSHNKSNNPLQNEITSKNSLKLNETSNYLQNNSTTKHILFWKRFFNNSKWVTGDSDEAGAEVLQSINCPVTNCIFTHNHTMLNDVSQFDAIAFHTPEYLMPMTMPQIRSDHQLYIMASLESPLATHSDLKLFSNFFNLTMTYRMDSDIRWDYGKFVDSETNEIIAPSPFPRWREPEDDYFDDKALEIFRQKSSPIAWFVSNCYAKSKRKNLMKKIDEKLKVDVYGTCGSFKCPVDDPACFNLLETKYKFYLSFENALCNDYVTEKLFRPMDKYVIPIVFNGGNTTLFAPPNSFIDANKFDSVDDLVTYLNYLMDNPQEYVKYFWWKKYYHVIQHPVYQFMLCDVCKKLNDEKFMGETHRKDDIYSWWNKKQCRTKADIKF